MKIATIGLDLAKRLFQLHWVDMETGEICRRQVKRSAAQNVSAGCFSAACEMEPREERQRGARKRGGQRSPLGKRMQPGRRAAEEEEPRPYSASEGGRVSCRAAASRIAASAP